MNRFLHDGEKKNDKYFKSCVVVAYFVTKNRSALNLIRLSRYRRQCTDFRRDFKTTRIPFCVGTLFLIREVARNLNM